MKKTFIYLSFLCVATFSGCGTSAILPLDRESAIPADATKMTPADDPTPPILHSTEFLTPAPVADINTAGAEDSPFIDGNRLFFFFTPDTDVPVEKQLFDGVTGIYVSKRTSEGWGKAERVLLQKSGKLALDGCEYAHGDTLWFCSTREGYEDIHWFTAENKNDKWQNWKNADFDPSYEVGELHFSADGNTLYYHSARTGGEGNLDIWVSQKENGQWQTPTNLTTVNTAENDGWPYLAPSGKELWFLRTYRGTPAIFRSRLIDDKWQTPELIISQFAGEPTLDPDGNLYFVHHYYKNGKMIEADIYVAKKK